MNSEATLSLFVYGTLKSGFPAHEHFFGGDANIEEAMVRGALFDLPAGYPALAVPGEDILATGTADVVSDAGKQLGRIAVRRKSPASGETVHGEAVRFGYPEWRLPALDAFEGFEPEGASLHARVLIPAWRPSGEAFPAWAYVTPSGARLPEGIWPLPKP